MFTHTHTHIHTHTYTHTRTHTHTHSHTHSHTQALTAAAARTPLGARAGEQGDTEVNGNLAGANANILGGMRMFYFFLVKF